MKLSVVVIFFLWFSKSATGVLTLLKKLSSPNLRSLSEAVTSTETHRLVGNSENAEFGTALALRGNSIFVGSPEYNNGSGKLSTYNLESGEMLWELEGHENDKIGSVFSVSGDGTRVAIVFRGVVSLYNFDGIDFAPMVNPPHLSSKHVSGVTLSSDGKQLAVSDNYDSLNKGRVTIFTLSNDSSSWEASAEFVDSVNQAMFGSIVCFSKYGDRIAIAAWNRGKSALVRRAGMVRVYGRSFDGSWLQIGSDLTGNTDNEQFGRATALSGDGQTLVVGSENSMGEGRSRGSVWVYRYADEWIQVGQQIFGENDLDRFGRSVAVSGDGRRFAASSYFHNAQRGQVRIFDLDDNGTVWNQVLEIEGEESQDRMGFGLRGLEMSDDGSHLVVGLTRASDDTVGLNDVGAVWVLDISSPPGIAPNSSTDTPSKTPSHLPSTSPSGVSFTYPTKSPSSNSHNLPTSAPSGLVENPVAEVPTDPSLASSGNPKEVPSSRPSDANMYWPLSNPFIEASASAIPFPSSHHDDILAAGPSSTDWSHPSLIPSDAEPTSLLPNLSLGPNSYITTSPSRPSRAPSIESTEMPTHTPSVSFITIGLSHGNVSPETDGVKSAGLRGGTSNGARIRDVGMLGLILIVVFTNSMF